MKVRRSAVHCAALSCALLSACSTPLESSSAENAANRDGLAYSARNVDIIEHGADGEPRYRVRAARASQKIDGPVIELRDLTMDLRDPGGRRWNVRAQHGRMPPNASTVDLQGNVIVTGDPAKSAPAIELRSEQLAVEVDARRVRSPAAVTIRFAGKQITAVGIKADLNAQTVQLESKVHGVFARK